MTTHNEEQRCRLCGETLTGVFYTQGNRGEFTFRRCGTCSLVNYDLAGGLDQGKYARDFPDPLDDAHSRNRPQTVTYKFLSRFLKPPGRLLDIGCGNGRLLHLARRDGWTVSGVELSPFLAESVHQRLGIPVHVANIQEPELTDRLRIERVDASVLRHVLEHLPDPHAVMRLFSGLLVPGGHVVLEFPNIDALHFRIRRLLHSVNLHQKAYPPDYRPGHCNAYNRQSFAHLAGRWNFNVVAWESYSRDAWRNWVLNRWPVGTKARTLIRMRPGQPGQSVGGH